MMKRMTPEEMQEEIERLNLQMDEVERRISATRNHIEIEDHEFDETEPEITYHRKIILTIILIVIVVAYNIYH